MSYYRGEVYNPYTGEIIEKGTIVYVQAKVKLKEGFFMGMQEAFLIISKDKELRGNPRAVLDYMFGKLGFENYICITQKEISEELDMDKANVSKYISLLTSKGILIEGPKLGRTKTFKLNSNYGWRGKIKNLSIERRKKEKEIEEREKRLGLRLIKKPKE